MLSFIKLKNARVCALSLNNIKVYSAHEHFRNNEGVKRKGNCNERQMHDNLERVDHAPKKTDRSRQSNI